MKTDGSAHHVHHGRERTQWLEAFGFYELDHNTNTVNPCIRAYHISDNIILQVCERRPIRGCGHRFFTSVGGQMSEASS